VATKVPSDLATELGSEYCRDWTLGDESLKDFWAYHFPRRKESSRSKAALNKLIRIVTERATTCAEPESTADVAHRFGIPLAEFYEFEREG